MNAAKVGVVQEPAVQRNGERSQTSIRSDAAPPGLRWLSGIVVAGALLIPLIMSVAGEDPFRYPKALALRAEIILIIMVLAVMWGFTRAGLPRPERREPWLLLIAAICTWTLFCALVSTNRLVSFPTAAHVLEYALLFVVTVLVMRGRPAWFAGLLVLPAIINSVIYLLQELELWSPFKTSTAAGEHLARTALLGNPNDVGSYFVAPALVAAALALSQRRWRIVWAAAGAFLIAATFVTHTAAAIGTLIVALPVMLVLWGRSWRKTLLALAAAIVLAGIVVARYPPLRTRVATMREAFGRRDFETLSSSRMIPFLAALKMARDRPLTGVGPGCFAYNFFDYKLRAQNEHRWMFGPGITVDNFGEVHNDHLQVLSETGVPGYALFLAALALLAWPSLRRRAAATKRGDEDASRRDRLELVRLTALPLSVSMFVLALAQFPLEVVASTHAYLWAAAAVVAWKEP
jgi:O-antigen ligase